MTDDDYATLREEQFRDYAVSIRSPEGPPPCGQCLNCGETLEGVRRWCDEDCRTDWEKRT